ncbi:MAG: IPTL-CTERM sorting domain-containing protein, partial [Xanthomonadales bacterium]|nr:IPTL-CTERM sorting domain-containing protein [Xanthomonadales bacterium]
AVPGPEGTEVCNDVDDDCDGQTDEDAWPDKGTGCMIGKGICARPGILISNSLDPAGATVCSASPGTGSDEVCNGLDDDCDGSTDEVDVTLTCNTGLPLEQSFTIAGGDPDGVTFVLTNIPEGGADCSVTESGAPSGYTTELNGGAGCSWVDVTSGLSTCEITNVADPATFTVTKDWIFFNDEAGGDLSFDDEVSVTITCNNDILTVDTVPTDPDTTEVVVALGDGDSATIEVDTTQGPASCSAVEVFTQSGVEEDSEGCGQTRLEAGDSHTCAFTNTLFFEGIPTLSQYGLAILVLLTLGLGLVGVRRFV